jgi:hypothetical protein
MTRNIKAALFVALASIVGGAAAAQSGGQVSVEQDIRKHDRIENAIDPRVAPKSEGHLPVQSDPSGVAGFNGPPGTLGDSVSNNGALPQGAAGNDIR